MAQKTQINPEALNVASQMILKEIDLTGTDAERKARLTQFETDWKALTGASDLTGARFIGRNSVPDDGTVITGVLSYDGCNYVGLLYASGYTPYKAESTTDGSLTITPLFSHLEAITIYTDNTPEHKQANLANITAYEANLQELGVTNVDGIMIPIKFEDDPENIAIPFSFSGYITKYESFYDGIVSTLNGAYKPRVITINGQQGEDGGKVVFETIALEKQLDNYTPKFLDAKSLEAITIKTGNTPEDKAANVAAIKAYVDNLKALGVDVTKGYMLPCKFGESRNGFIMQGVAGNYAGFIKNAGTYYGGGFVFVTTDGTYMSHEILVAGEYNNLTTNSKYILNAINEVNALAKGVKAFGAIELKASDNAANKAAVTAYLKILTDAGVSTTNGYSVPVRITGNSQEYHGMLNIGTGVLLSGVVTDVNENHHYPFNVSTTDGVITFDENNYFLEKASNEVTEMLDAIKYSYTAVPFTDTTLSNKAQLEVFLSKVPNATVMHCTYKEIWAGTLHKINGDWYGLLVKNTNSPADNINVKLSADGTIVTSNSAQ